MYSPPSVFIASRVEDLNSLRRHWRDSRKHRIQIVLPGLEETRRLDFERRLERYRSGCGCNEGSIAGLLYLILVPLLLLTGWLAPRSLLAKGSLVAGLVAFLVVGKIFGLLLARWRFISVLKEVERMMLDQAKER